MTKGKATADGMELKADAWKEYQKAAKLAMWLDAIPTMTAEVAAPLSQVNRITMIGDIDSKESVGPARLTGEIMSIVEKIPESTAAMTGYKMRLV